MVDFEGFFFLVEGGEICVCGVEIEVKVVLLVSVNVVGFYIYIDVEYIIDIIYKGNMFVQVLKYMVLLWVDYIFFDGLFLGLMLGIGGCYIGFSYGDLVNFFKVGSYMVVDVLVCYDLV